MNRLSNGRSNIAGVGTNTRLWGGWSGGYSSLSPACTVEGVVRTAKTPPLSPRTHFVEDTSETEDDEGQGQQATVQPVEEDEG